MESGQGIQTYKSTWRPLFIGILLGILISFLVVVVIAFKWGPQGESIEIDLYSGNIILHKFFLSKRTHTKLPKEPHVQWAIDHQNPVKGWYLPGSSIARSEWFSDMMAVTFTARSYVYEIYSLKIPEKEKVNLLHQYHQDLDTMKIKQAKHYKSVRFMEEFYIKWAQNLEQITKDSQQVAPKP